MKNRLFAIFAILAFVGIAYYAWVRWKQAYPSSYGDAQLVQSSASDDENSKVLMDKAEVDRLRAAADHAPAQNSTPTMSVPATDSIPPNPPDNMKFSGTGRYQLYRQGNLTWRLDTDSGRTCIIFATDEEWHKPRVSSQGCGNQ